MPHHRVVVAEVHQVAAHDGVEVAVLGEDRLDVSVPGGLRGYRVEIEEQDADEIPRARVVVGGLRRVRELIPDPVHLAVDVAARIAGPRGIGAQ